MKKRGHKFRVFRTILVVAVIYMVICQYSFVTNSIGTFLSNPFCGNGRSVKKIEAYANANGIDMSEYSEELISLYERNPDASDFVLEYPLKKNETHEINLSKYENCKTVPLLMQWDQDWGYSEYAGDLFGLTGCGPTSLSMVTIYLTGDVTMNPKKMAEFATKNNYTTNGNGSKWTLFSEGGKKLGLDVTELPLDETRIINNLEVGNPIICAMGPGDFTTSGHFIVLVGYEDGKIKINDPNSYQNSKKLWSFEKIKDQIKNLWAFR